MPSKHISPSANTSNPLHNCPHAPKTYFTQCQHVKPPFQLPPCPQNIFPKVPAPQNPFPTAPMPSKHISHRANTSNPLFNCPHALKTHSSQCQHPKSPFQLPQCPQNIFHIVPTPRTPLSTDPMPSKQISPNTNTSNPLSNCPHALKTYFTQCQHLEPPFQLPPCPQNILHTVSTPQPPFATASMPSKHISPNANTGDPLFNCPHALKTHFTQCQHLEPRFQLPSCHQNIFHQVATPRTPFSTSPMPSKHISPSGNTLNPLFNFPDALKTNFTQRQHLEPPFQLPPCPENTFHPMPTPQTPLSIHPMPSKRISPSANTSNPLFNCPHAHKTHFTKCQHLTSPFQLPPCPKNIVHPVPTPQTPFSTAPMTSKHI